ncbi:MAG TPA: hypothetical protein VGB24_17985 [Longimicrobium sp.]|jgi:hypothetical protein|uniref:hypothetical protein n=1 Tax=Longimicrobium sp. TaxID=2029185 RepID=UPI002EDBA443
MLRGRFLTAMGIALAATLAGCSDPAGSDGRITGEYTLRTVGGFAIPASPAPMHTIHSGSLELRPGGRFAFTLDASVPGEGIGPSRRVATDEGTYTTNGNSISLFYEDVTANAVPVTGVVSGSTLMLAMAFGGTWVFVR